jgi:hypothetical protein
MRILNVKVNKKAVREEKQTEEIFEIDHAASNIVRKTLEMAETFRKFPRPARK